MLNSIPITINRQEYTMRPTFNWITKLEQRYGMSILKYVNSKIEDMTAVDVIFTIKTAINNGAQAITDEAIMNHITDNGLQGLVEPLHQLFVVAIVGPKKPQDQAGE